MSRVEKTSQDGLRDASAKRGFRVQRVLAPVAVVIAFSMLGYLLWMT